MHYAQELAVGTSVGNEGLTALVFDNARRRYPIMSVTTENYINPAHHGCHFQIHIHAIVREHHDHIRFFILTHGIDDRLHIRITNTKCPVRDKTTRVGNRCIRECLSDHRHAYPIHVLDDIGLERPLGIFIKALKVCELIIKSRIIADKNILADEITLEVTDIGNHFFVQISEFPMAGHDIDTQVVTGTNHVLATSPVSRTGTLPGVPAVQQQGLVDA